MNIEAVKNALISLAIRGKLVPQRDDEPAVEQLGEAPEEAPFEIPQSWSWVALASAVVLENGDRGKNYPAKSKLSVSPTADPFVSAINLNRGRLDYRNMLYLNKQQYSALRSGKIQAGDVLLCIRGSLGKFALTNKTGGAIASSLVILRGDTKFIDPRYLSVIISSDLFKSYISEGQNGTAQPNLGAKTLGGFLIPLPPLAEQRRIVAKLEELLEPLSRVQERLGNLTHDFPEQFKAAVLQKAIQGKLVPQRDDEPAVEQLGEAPEEAPFEIPAKWKWVTLSTVGKIVGGGTPKTQIPEYWVDGNIPWITPADLGKVKSKFIAAGAKCITDLGLKKSAAQLMPAGTVLFSSRAPIGHIAIARQNCCTNQGCKSLVPNTALISSDWGYYVMKTFTPDMINRATGTTFKEISGKGVAATVIPLPPLAEQRRIVEKVEQLFSQVDELTARLSS